MTSPLRSVPIFALLLLALTSAAPAWGQSISGVSPTTPYPGHPVTIAGSGFSNNTSDVAYNGTSVAFTVISDTEIRARVPAGATSDASFEVTTSSGTATSSTISLDTGAPYGPERGLTLDGTGDYVEGPSMELTGSALTIEAWVKPSQFPNTIHTIAGIETTTDLALLRVGDDGLAPDKPQFVLRFSGTAIRVNSGSALSTGTWQHVAGVYDGSEMRLYVDGELVGSRSQSGSFTANDVFRISRSANGRYFFGEMDQVRVWTTALSTAEVWARARRTIAPGDAAFSDLAAAWRFDAEGSGGPAFGFSGNFRNGTFQGDAARTTFSGALLGQESAQTTGSAASVGPSGGTVEASGVSAGSGETIQLYRFGQLGASARTGSEAGDDLSGVPAGKRSDLTWGLGTVGSPSATVTIDYSGVSSVSAPVILLRRSGPGDPWQRATGWSQDESAQTFTRTGTVPERQYAVAPAQIYVDKGATGANDGSSWADAYTDLQTAIDNATAENELWVAEGVYKPDSEGDSFTITGAKDGLEMYGGFARTESRRSARDPGSHPTVLSGDIAGDDADPDADGIIEDASDLQGGENAHHVLFLDGTTGGTIRTSTVIDGVTVTAGQADGSSPDDQGGGLYCDASAGGTECTPTFRNLVFIGNAASGDGGAIFNDGTQSGTSSPHITNAVFTGNSADEGGAIYNDGVGGTSSPIITNATFKGNSASSSGGAMYNNGAFGSSAPQITNTILWGNTADADGDGSGSGDEIFNDGGNDTATLAHTIIEGGVDGSGVGGFTNNDGGGNLDQDPQFSNAADPEGSDGTFATQDDGLAVTSRSPALDAGDNSAVPSGVTEDVTGAARIQDVDGDGTATVTIGAYELPGPGPPIATTGSAQNVAGTTAELTGTVDPSGLETTVQAQVYPTADPSEVSTITASASPLNGLSEESVTTTINGLSPNVEYEARVIASNSDGGDRGSYVTFTTTSDGYARRIKGTDGTGNDAGWRMLAFPAAGKTRAALEDDLEFDVGSGSILYRWTSGSWTAKTSSTDNLPRGRGFMLFFFDDPFETIDSGGIPLAVSTGSEDQTVDKTVSSVSTSEDFHLLGNPFDAAFDLSALNLSSQGFQTTVQIWDPSAGSYTTVTQASDDSDVIGAWQGLFVERDPNASTAGTSLTFSTSGKQTGNGSLIGSKSTSLLAGGSAARQNTTSKQAETKRVRLALRLTVTGEASDEETTPPGPSNQTTGSALGGSPQGEGSPAPPTRDTSKSGAPAPAAAEEAEPDTLATNRATVLFTETATAGWDAYEASQLTPFSSGGYATLSSPLLQATSSQSDSTLVRRALASEPFPTDTTAIRLPVSVRSVGTAGTATIGWPEDSRDRLPEGWGVELIDTEIGERVDLRTESYSFDLGEGDGEVASPSDSRFRLAVGPASAIPVELAAFEAQAVAEESVRLTWKTASEQNNAGFAVQRRRGEGANGRGGAWTRVGFVESKAEGGTTSQPQRYRFTDADLPYTAETPTYRLKQMDTDGSVHFSKEVVVERAVAQEMTLKAPFPSPVRMQATVQYALPKPLEVRLALYDVLGRKVRTLANGREEAGRKEIQLDASRLSSGTYLLRLTAGGEAKTRKLTVVH